MTHLTVTLAEFVHRLIEIILHDVANERTVVTAILPGGEQVRIEPKPTPKPLPVLEGSVPGVWKDALYSRGSVR